jgi:DNA (cytosine-5)-methyltransferase 1
MKSLEIFSGGGGLALGMAQAGFEHVSLVEWNHDSCETLRKNQEAGFKLLQQVSIVEQDVRNFNFVQFQGKVDLVAGGPPCQPFSLGGKHEGQIDERNMFPEAVRAVREVAPKAFIFENVKGLTRKSFDPFFQYIVLQLTFPNIVAQKGETWENHFARLRKNKTSKDLSYNVKTALLNAADFGVPQKRERVFFVGIRNDIGEVWSPPEPTHTKSSLLVSQFVNKDYWERHQVPKNQRTILEANSDSFRRSLSLFESRELPWKTVRDAIHDLPDPEKYNRVSQVFLNHEFRDGAKIYPGHTGSPIDEPAKTIKAGAHGVPGGENMIAFPDGRVRYFTVRESARIQTFSDDYFFMGAWGESMRQLGNAVPPLLASSVGTSVKALISKTDKSLVAQKLTESVRRVPNSKSNFEQTLF